MTKQTVARQALKIVGFGFRQQATRDSLEQVLDQLIAQYGPIDRLAAARSMLPLVQALGHARSMPVIGVADATLASVTTLTHSAYSLREKGTGSVAEAVALLAAGSGARLLGPRRVSDDRKATAAVAMTAAQGVGL
ncbi:cobalamin biosynthesis protein [Vreelandella populi]|uniref:Cobalamin biosynthesis protein n=1 Tax=Vreelandella populi TaxID=2498858 RepID=A0A433LH54_9GAMM|nr:cobalamin biosynthesis protein [Halomonas populi]RUR40851.1 cobalamin biosynthesis protein [Halomonas populi]RUR49358.1 cobalamin biosynthesis protein [Halomonas populi]